MFINYHKPSIITQEITTPSNIKQFGVTESFNIDNSITIEVAEVEPINKTDCLVFSCSNGEFILGLYDNSDKWHDGVLEYLTDDKSEWTEWDGQDIQSVNSKIYLRGSGNTNVTGDGSGGLVLIPDDDDAKIYCDGDIETLLDWGTVRNGEHPEIPEDSRCFSWLFTDCTSLERAPTLSPTKLSYHCYEGMFWGCTSLLVAPELPALELTGSCYANMFKGCTSLTSTPELPGVVPDNWYSVACTSCYEGMFEGCTSLVRASKLPSISATNIYKNMFKGCISLETLPVLAKKDSDLNLNLTNYCYEGMFDGCIKIKISKTQEGDYQTPYRIPPEGILSGQFSLLNMFRGTGGPITTQFDYNTMYYTSNEVLNDE